jgi:hypothetical protein
LLILLPRSSRPDGVAETISDGRTLSLPGGVNIFHAGNVYLVFDQSGISVRAADDGNYMNVTVGLGRWPQAVQGILTNVKGHPNEIAARTGRTLTAPFAINDLYETYAQSWRVPANDSLLSVCADRVAEIGVPSKSFYANDLEPNVQRRAEAVCVAAGVTKQPYLDSCIVDVTFTGKDSAAETFVGLPAPVVVGLVKPKRGVQTQHANGEKGGGRRHKSEDGGD